MRHRRGLDLAWEHNFQSGIWDCEDIGDPANTVREERIHRTAENHGEEVADFVQKLSQMVGVCEKKLKEFQSRKHAQHHKVLNKVKAEKATENQARDSPFW